MQASSDLKELLLLLVEKKVKFLIVGGYALAYYHEPRYTKDIDLWIDNTKKNSSLVYSALKEFGAPVQTIDSNFFTHEDHFFKMGKDPLRVDIICGMKGLDFKEAWKNKKKSSLFSIPVYYISIDHLIKLKEIAARPQDLVDVMNLKEVLIKK